MKENELSPRERAALKTRQRAQEKRERWQAELDDRKKAVEILRSIRDDPLSTNAEKLRAIELLGKRTS